MTKRKSKPVEKPVEQVVETDSSGTFDAEESEFPPAPTFVGLPADAEVTNETTGQRHPVVGAAVLYTNADGHPHLATIAALFGANVDLNVDGRLVELVAYSETPALGTWRWPAE